MASQTLQLAAATDPQSPPLQATASCVYDDTDLSVVSVTIVNNAPHPCTAFITDTATKQNVAGTIAANTSHTYNVPNNRYFLVNDPAMGLGPGPTVELGIGF